MLDKSPRDKNLLKKLYFEMLRIRRVEEKLTEWFNAGLIKAPVHLSIGQEAVAVGVMAALKPQDKIVSTHRCHGHYLAKGGDLKKMMAEILGKATGCCKGKGGTMHLLDDEAGLVVSVPLVAASISFAVGLAFSFKMKSEDKIAVAFFGDGAVEEGIFWESVNFASVHKLPVLFVCENNLYATHSHILSRQPSERIVGRIRPFISNACRIENANSVLNVVDIAETVVDEVRQNEPGFIEACTYRLKEHWGVGEDWHLGYRSRKEGEKWIAKCPFKQLQKVFNEEDISQSEIEKMDELIKQEINEAVEFAFNSPLPSQEELLTEVGGENE
ncbi:MAG: thiamine pyrophosphate-dependent dehydrogenase E1 component subunit alpha [Candidatus Azambacteria bacterium]|nr:thiamine pyrophosphate-dependent dehydrogenase E1 component subunit alpha [Candidatus Azambacteria bacterium]